MTPSVEVPTWINSLKFFSWGRLKEAWDCKQQGLGKRQPQAEPVHNCAQDLWVAIWFLLSWRSLDHAWANVWLAFPLSILLHFAMEFFLGLFEHKAGSLLCFLKITGEKTRCCSYLGLHWKGCSRVSLSSAIPNRVWQPQMALIWISVGQSKRKCLVACVPYTLDTRSRNRNGCFVPTKRNSWSHRSLECSSDGASFHMLWNPLGPSKNGHFAPSLQSFILIKRR